MENKNFDQYESQERIEPKIRVSRDGKWLIIRIPGVEQPIIKAVAYFEAIIRRAKDTTRNMANEAERIKD